MAVWRGAMLLGLGLMLSGPLAAQEAATQPVLGGRPILVVDEGELFSRSKFGQALRAKLAEASDKAQAEARRLDREAEEEERALTQRRATMTPQDFAPLAAAFDAKVQKLRAERDAAAADLLAMETAAKQQFYQAALQVIGDFMVAQGAVAVIDKSITIVSLSSLDVTDAVIAELDRVLGTGASPAP